MITSAAKIAIAISSTIITIRSSGTSESQQWALDYLSAQQSWTITKGEGVTVAIIDSGVSPNADIHSLLEGADFSDASGRSIGDGHIDTQSNGHGTGMASIICGSGQANSNHGTIGLAPAAQILPVRVTSNNNLGLLFNIPSALNFAVAHKARVINLAITGTTDDPATHMAIDDARDHDVVIVAGVGNEGIREPRYPAAYPGVLGVGAIDSTGTVWSKSNSGPDVALVAPGVHIYRDDNHNRQGYSDGTSEATAYVSAAAALVRSAHPDWTAPEVVAALISTADKPAALHGAVRDDHYGAGILDVLAALRLTSPPASSPSASVTTEPPPLSSSVDRSVTHSASAGGPQRVAIFIGGAALALVLAALLGLRYRRGRLRRHSQP